MHCRSIEDGYTSPHSCPGISRAVWVIANVQDGTITDRDSNDFLIDNLGFGAEKR